MTGKSTHSLARTFSLTGESKLVVEDKKFRWDEWLVGLHERSGYHRDSWLNDAWAVVLDIFCLSLLLWIGSGIYLWIGLGGKIYKVTNLNVSGPGSLQEACSASGPRIVVFDTSGVIPGTVTIIHGQITIMGQTAPGAPG